MLSLTGTQNYYLFNGSIDMRKGVYGLSEVVRHEMKENPNNPNNVYIFHVHMNGELIIEFYRSQLAAANEEKGMLYAQVKALTEEVSMLRSSMQDTSQRIDELLSEIKSLHDTLKAKDKRIADLEEQLSNAFKIL